jgi:hypothetical protein
MKSKETAAIAFTLATTLGLVAPNFDLSKANAQVNGEKVLNCDVPEGPIYYAKSLSVTPEQSVTLGNPPRQLQVRLLHKGVELKRITNGRVEPMNPDQERTKEEIVVTGNRVTFQPEGQGISAGVAYVRQAENTYLAAVMAFCLNPKGGKK